MLRSLLLGSFLTNIFTGESVMIPINDTIAQSAYYANERYEFGIDGSIAPFDGTLILTNRSTTLFACSIAESF